MQTPEQRAAFVMSQAVAAMVELAAMQAENNEHMLRLRAEDTNTAIECPPCSSKQIEALIDKYQLGYNSVVETLRG